MRNMIPSSIKRLRHILPRRVIPRPVRPAAPPLAVERAEQIFYIKYLREGMTVFDVGANVGELTLLFSRFVGHGQVHAFEPTSIGFERLATVCKAIGRSNTILNRFALAEKEGVVRLHVYDEDHFSWSSITRRPLEKYGIQIAPEKVEEIPAATIDGYCKRNGIGQIDLLKIDVEGAEFQVLLGARRMLQSKRIRCVTFEFGQTTFDMGNDPEAFWTYLDSLGYKLRNVVKGDPVFPGRSGPERAQFSMHVATPK